MDPYRVAAADTLGGATITHNALKRAADSLAQYMDSDAQTRFVGPAVTPKEHAQ